jgi:hypothetical protein
MALQYVCDSSGNRLAVIIPIADWNRLKGIHEDLKELENNDLASDNKTVDSIGDIDIEPLLK